MNEEEADRKQAPKSAYRVRLPGFISEEDVGLGDVIKRITYRLGVKPCSGCQRRATMLNRWVAFTGRSK
jgi:hypothetical protein